MSLHEAGVERQTNHTLTTRPESEVTMKTQRSRVRGITLRELVGDALDARRSGKSGIPTVGDAPPTPTGRQSEIARGADEQIAMLRRGTQIATTEQEAELAKLNERIRQIQDHIDAISADENAILTRASERLPIEAEVPVSVISSRRATDNRKAAAPLRQQIDELVTERDRLGVLVAELDYQIVMIWRHTRAQARAVGEAALRREARYFRLLCKAHPDGTELASKFDHQRLVLPLWVEGPADERSL